MTDRTQKYSQCSVSCAATYTTSDSTPKLCSLCSHLSSMMTFILEFFSFSKLKYIVGIRALCNFSKCNDFHDKGRHTAWCEIQSRWMKLQNAKVRAHSLLTQYCLLRLLWGDCGTSKGAGRGTEVYSGKCGIVTSYLALNRLQTVNWSSRSPGQAKEYLCLGTNLEKRCCGIQNAVTIMSSHQEITQY